MLRNVSYVALFLKDHLFRQLYKEFLNISAKMNINLNQKIVQYEEGGEN